jgi:hypothetical protein
MTTLPADIARCPGEGFEEDDGWHWREGCDDCLRRTAPGGRVSIAPPVIVVFECEHRIAPGEAGRC